MSGFNFGAPASSTTQTGSAFSFGTQSAAPVFGTPASAAPAFGTPGFNATSTPAFGTGTKPAFGAAPTFGAATSAPFGSVSTTATSENAPAAVGLSFGAQPAASGLGFGAQPAASGLGFGAQPATSALGFGAQPAASGLNFGATAAATTASSNFSFGLGGGNVAATTSSTILPTGFPTTTSATLNFGTTTTSAPMFGGSLGSTLFGKPIGTGMQTGTMPSLTTTVPAATAPTPFVGLGGIDMCATQPKAGESKQNVKVKETQVPDEIAKTVEALKSFIKSQKTLSSDIGRTSTSKLSNVSSEITSLHWTLQEIANLIEENHNQIRTLRKETHKAIQTVEMAQRTNDTPAGLQFENVAPFQYFQHLVAKYEQELIHYRQQISLTERHMNSLTNPQTISPEELKRGFRQINECFISLAGRQQELHQKVEAQKEQFLCLRRYRLRDSTNVFEKIDNPMVKVDPKRVAAGPTPFSIVEMNTMSRKFDATVVAEETKIGSSTIGQISTK